MQCEPIRAQAWLDAHEGELEGLPVEDAVALVESAGLHARLLPSASGWMTQEMRRDRVNLWRGEDGTVGSTDAG